MGLLDLLEQAYVNTCLEFKAEVLITDRAIVAANPRTGEKNTKSRARGVSATPAREAVAVCTNLGLG